MKDREASTSNDLTTPRLRALLAVSEMGSFAAAGRQLGVSHVAVSQQIRRLEASRGVHLFDRVSGALRPTPMCLELCEIAERILAAERDAARVLERRDVDGTRRIRIGLGNAMPGVALIGGVIRDHQGLSVTLLTGSHHTIMSAVLRREVDLAILPDVPSDRRFRREPLMTQSIVAIVGPASSLAATSRTSIATLAEQPLIFRATGSSTQRHVDRAFARAGLVPQPVLIADTRDAVYEAVTSGIGVGFMWSHGTQRRDSVRCLEIDDMTRETEEAVFALADERNDLVDLVFHAARRYRGEG